MVNKDNIKEYIASVLSSGDKLVYLLDSCSEEFGEDERIIALCRTAIQELEYSDIIYPIDNKRLMYGIHDEIRKQILLDGGWINHKEKSLKRGQEKSRVEKAINEKAITDARLSELQLKTFWWLFGIAIIGGICGIVSLVWQIISR